MSKKLEETSKFLSFVLRHKPDAIGLNLDHEGWASIGELIEKSRSSGHGLDETLLCALVRTSDKKRFTISEDGLRIRAAQGHSLASVSIIHQEKSPPYILYHGTAERFLESVMEQGLIPGARQHVHLSENEETATAVGKRYGRPVVLRIAASEMSQQGHKFFQAENGVWLTEHVPAIFLELQAPPS